VAEKKKKRKGRWSHLQDFYTDLSGKAVYAGKMIRYAGDLPWRDAAVRTGVLVGAVTACVFAVFCLPAPSMTGLGKHYVVLPLLLEAVGVLLTVWAAVRLLYNGPDLRAYVWDASARKLPWWLEMTAVFAGVSAVCNVVFLALNGFCGRVFLSLLVIALHLAVVACAVPAIRFLRSLRWDGGEELTPRNGD
jgi:hypothetical protein